VSLVIPSAVTLASGEVQSALKQSLEPDEIYRRLSPSVFTVETLDAKGVVIAFGSGVAISSHNVVTNAHVVAGGKSFRVKQDDHVWPAIVDIVEADADLARLEVLGLNAIPVVTRDPSDLAVGERVYAIGTPKGLELSLSEGLISGFRTMENERVIQTTAAISPGSSGGGLFDAQARLIGITSSSIRSGQSLNFAIPIANAAIFVVSGGVGKNPAHPLNVKTSAASNWLALADDAIRAGEQTKAITILQAASGEYPNDPLVWRKLASAYSGERRSGEAVAAYERALKLNPEQMTPGLWLLLGLAYWDANRRADGLRLAERLTKDDPTNAYYWRLLGFMRMESKQPGPAVDAYQRAIQLRPKDMKATDIAAMWKGLGLSLGALHKYKEAISAFEERTRLEPDNPGVWNDLGDAYINAEPKQKKDASKAYERAIELYRVSLTRNSDDVESLRGLGHAYWVLGKSDQAGRLFSQALHLAPNDPNVWFDFGAFNYWLMGKTTEVTTRTYDALRKLDPQMANDFFARYMLPKK
jgi:tetratricopeptide (TPR) repeat protein